MPPTPLAQSKTRSPYTSLKIITAIPTTPPINIGLANVTTSIISLIAMVDPYQCFLAGADVCVRSCVVAAETLSVVVSAVASPVCVSSSLAPNIASDNDEAFEVIRRRVLCLAWDGARVREKMCIVMRQHPVVKRSQKKRYFISPVVFSLRVSFSRVVGCGIASKKADIYL